MAYIDSNYGSELEAALRKLASRPVLGQPWFGFHESEVPAGVLLFTAGTHSRILYADFWQYVQDKNLVKTEEEWQSIYSTQGWCPFYSDGDGIDTFRMPSAPLYLCGANTLGQAGAYVAEGLPDHTHTRGTMNITGGIDPSFDNIGVPFNPEGFSGAFYGKSSQASYNVSISATGGTTKRGAAFDASRTWTGSTSTANTSNPIYGASAHVTPATSKLLFGVWAISTSGVTIPDTNAEAILAAVRRSADTDLSNLTTTGKEVTVKMGMPSARYVDLSLPADGGTITAPANGSVQLAALKGTGLQLYNKSRSDYWSAIDNPSDGPSCVSIPCQKGDVIQIYYGFTVFRWFRFYYAEGAE